ncbi:hypothetical protein QFC21_007269 [Naganishia friedmannii]|uniref:Uncharacterized protein n=1 Tax=Naganishia friedmannii TaxID=89922 RepID=A0ACC2UWL0_9TREE|nr:hypothetical protein QFC21_007269 [Naganishia friedmannii]
MHDLVHSQIYRRCSSSTDRTYMSSSLHLPPGDQNHKLNQSAYYVLYPSTSRLSLPYSSFSSAFTTLYPRSSLHDFTSAQGATTTFLPPHHIYLFGGRTVDTRRVTAGLFVLDLRTLEWTRIKQPPPSATGLAVRREQEGQDRNDVGQSGAALWPSARYFHTTDVHRNQLIVFGGMGSSPPASATTTGIPAGTTTTADQPCVLSDLWIFDIPSSKWSCYPAASTTNASQHQPSQTTSIDSAPPHILEETDNKDDRQRNGQPVVVVQGRYAHLSAVVSERERLVVIGGQDISNTYVHQQVIFHIPTRRWESVTVRPSNEIRGSYRSVAVSSCALEETVPRFEAGAAGAGGVERRLTYSQPRRRCRRRLGFHAHGETSLDNGNRQEDEEQGAAFPASAEEGDIYLFSNSNFTDVQRELYSIAITESAITTDGSTPPVEANSTNLTAHLPSSPHAHAHTSAVQQQPPGLRFPFAAHIGHHLVLGGTYLSQSTAQFAVWALNLRTWQWEKISAHVLEGSGGKVVRRGESGSVIGGGGGLEETGLPGGSWNRAVYWPSQEASMTDAYEEIEEGKGVQQRQDQGGKLLVFGNRYKDLQDDYEGGLANGRFCIEDELRAINFDHVAVIELEVFGIYQPPLRHPLLQHHVQQHHVGMRPEGWMSDDNEDSRAEYALGLLHDGFLADFNVVCEDGRAIRCSSRVLEERWAWFSEQRSRYLDASPSSERRPKTLPRTLHISESYPIVKAFLEYLYTLDLVTSLQLRPPVLSGLLMMAKQYDMEHLERLAVHAMHVSLDESTALGIYEVATLCECRQLQVRALKAVLAMQKRAGKGSNHRRQPSAGPAAAMTAGGGAGGTLPPAAGPPASEGDSTRTVNDDTTTAGSASGYNHAYTMIHPSIHAGSQSSPYSSGVRVTDRLDSVKKASLSSTNHSEIQGGSDEAGTPTGKVTMNRAGEMDVSDSLADELVDEYDPPTYRTRRRSASVASLHHFAARQESMRGVTAQGQIIHHVGPCHPPPTVPSSSFSRAIPDDNANKERKLVTRKMTSMSSLLSFANRKNAVAQPSRRPSTTGTNRGLIKILIPSSSDDPGTQQVRRDQAHVPHHQAGPPPGEVNRYTSDSSSPSSPVTPTGPGATQHVFTSPPSSTIGAKKPSVTLYFAAPVLG